MKCAVIKQVEPTSIPFLCWTCSYYYYEFFALCLSVLGSQGARGLGAPIFPFLQTLTLLPTLRFVRRTWAFNSFLLQASCPQHNTIMYFDSHDPVPVNSRPTRRGKGKGDYLFSPNVSITFGLGKCPSAQDSEPFCQFFCVFEFL